MNIVNCLLVFNEICLSEIWTVFKDSLEIGMNLEFAVDGQEVDGKIWEGGNYRTSSIQ